MVKDVGVSRKKCMFLEMCFEIGLVDVVLGNIFSVCNISIEG